jgi:hypothetical protein
VPLYAKQLNVYAHIWQTLRGEDLDETAVICTVYPDALADALLAGDEERLNQELEAWEPVIEIPFDAKGVADTVADFASVVDCIEDHQFTAPTLEQLRQPLPGMRRPFGTAVCRNCDARFSCGSYRRWLGVGRRSSESSFRQYIEDLGNDTERDSFTAAALEASPTATLDDVT